LSHLELIRIGVRGHLASVARLSQYSRWMLVLASTLASGCVVPDAPEYGFPNETPVFVVQNSIQPDPRSVLHVKNAAGNSLNFSFQVQSEDLPEDGLITAIYLNYKQDDARVIDHKPKPPSTLDVARPINWHFDLSDNDIFPYDPSCKIITVTVLHAQYWNNENNQPIGNPSDMAAVSWIVDFNDTDPMNPVLLSSCPDASTMTTTTVP
jgi:hypothetical protein